MLRIAVGVLLSLVATHAWAQDYDAAAKGALEYLKANLPKWKGGNQKVDHCYIGLAFMAAGSTPTTGEYAAEVKICFDSVMAADGTGFNINWYYPMAGLFLAEVYRKEPSDAIRAKLEAIGQGMAKGQNASGGWSHNKEHTYTHAFTKKIVPDICFLTAMNVAALGAIKGLGVKIPDDVLNRALANLARNEDGKGGLGYGTNNSLFDKGGTRGAAALVGLHLMNSRGGAYGKYAQCVRERVKGFHQGHSYSPLHFFYGATALHMTGGYETLKAAWLAKLVAQNPKGEAVKLPHDEAIDMDNKDSPMSTAVFAYMLLLPKKHLYEKAKGGKGAPKNPFSQKD